MSPIMIFDLFLSKMKVIAPVTLVIGLLYLAGLSPDVTPDSSALNMAMSSIVALSVGGLAAILRMWVGRNPAAPTRNSKMMTVLIAAAVMVGCFHAYLDAEDMIAQEKDLARIMETIREIAIASGDDEIARVMEQDFGVVIEVPEDAGSTDEDTGTAEGADTGSPDADDSEPTEGEDAGEDSLDAAADTPADSQ